MTKYRSKLEERVADALGDSWKYEPESYPYVVNRKYTPDFTCGEIWIEVKGYFRPGDTAKYKAIRSCYPDHLLIMVFDKPFQPVRKGAKLTMADWAEKEGWKWTTPQALEEEGV